MPFNRTRQLTSLTNILLRSSKGITNESNIAEKRKILLAVNNLIFRSNT